jgi:intracellular multiplication protein IcmK
MGSISARSFAMMLCWRIALLALGVISTSLAPMAFGQTAPGQAGPPLAGSGPSAGDADLNDPSFLAAQRNAIPLTPAMIEDLKHRYDAVERAKTGEDGSTFLAMPTTRSVNVSLGPGGVTNIIQTVPGYPTAITFLDSTGQPWPIAWDTNGVPTTGGGTGGPAVEAVGFDVTVPVKGSNVLQLQPRTPYLRGGILVNLQGAPKPLAFMVISSNRQYDADVSVRVADRGPNARQDIIVRPDTPETGAPYLTAMLDGVPPPQAVPLSVEGVSPDDVRAWQMGERDYIRTRYTLLSPEWVASEDGADGTTIYAVPQTPVVLLSADGRTVAARLKEP